MADLKISQLSDGGASQATDEYVVARSGSNFRIDGASVAAAATSVGTLSSLTVSGATKFSSTVAMNGLTAGAWASPLASVIEGGAAGVASSSLIFQTNASGISMNANYFYDGVEKFKLTGDAAQINNTGTAISFKTASGSAGGTISWTNAMVITNAGRVGIGTASPSYELHALGNVNGSVTVASNNTSAGASAFSRFLALADAGNAQFGMTSSAYTDISGAQDAMLLNANSATGGIAFALDGVLKMKLDASGNLGIGVTPSAWSVLTPAMQLGAAGSFLTAQGSTAAVYLGTNAYFDGTNFRYVTSGASASYLSQAAGVLSFLNAPSGTAGNAITFTQAMTLDASGNLGVGCTPIVKTQVRTQTNGNLGIQASTVITGGNKINNFNDVGSASAPVELDASVIGFLISAAEKARITSGGYFKASNNATYIDVTGGYHEFRSTGANATVYTSNTHASDPYGIRVHYTAATPNNTDNWFLYCNDNTAVRAYIRSNGGLTNYQANNTDLSDARTKTDITPAASMWDKVAALEIVTYKYTDQTHDDVNVGVIAQQVETVEPVWVDTDGFGETPEGEEPLKTVYTKDITFAAIKALQEAMARIEALEARLEALEA